MELFTLQAQVVGQTYCATASNDGSGIVVDTDRGPIAVRSVKEAMRAARDYLGPLPQTASRNHAPWGLYVGVSGVAAVYGSWPLLPGGPPSSPATVELVTRIRREYHDGSATAALETRFASSRRTPPNGARPNRCVQGGAEGRPHPERQTDLGPRQL